MNSLIRFAQTIDDDQQGTSLTEFVITLPIFLLILAGVIDLGALLNATVLVEIEANHAMLDGVQEVESESLDLGVSTVAINYSQPSIAAARAVYQLESNPPRRATPAGRSFVRLFEHSTYSITGMALSGSWGESHSRVRRLQDFGIELAGVEEVVTSHPEQLFGNRMTGSMLSNDLLNDGPQSRFDSENYQRGGIRGITSLLNDAVSTAGMRGALAAGTRYGTVTERREATVQVNRGMDRTFGVHMTSTVGPYVNDDPWESALRSTAVTRFTFFNNRLGYYNETLAFDGSNPFRIDDLRTLEVPTPAFSGPLQYDAKLYE